MLNRLIEIELEELNVPVETGFKVTDLNTANWVFRKMNALRTKVDEISNVASAELKRIEEWEQKETSGIYETLEYFEKLLSDYYKELKANDPKAKLKTPYGKVTSRKWKRLEFEEEAVISYLKENKPELIRVTESIDRVNFRKVFADGIDTETGEVIPGVEVTEKETVNVQLG